MADDTPQHAFADLVAARKQALAADESWANYDDHQTTEALTRLETLQAAMLGADFSTADNRLSALSLLLENEDHPNFVDDFKNSLFHALRSVILRDDTTGGA